MTDYPDYQAPQAHANAIAATGVGLLRFANSKIGVFSHFLSGGATVTLFGPAAWTQPAWTLASFAQSGLGAMTAPWIVYLLTWLDPSGTQVIDIDELIAPIGSSGNAVTVGGNGPAKGEQLMVTVTNQDPSITATYTAVMTATSHVFDRPRWRMPQFPSAAPSGFTLPGGDPQRGIVCYSTPAVTVGTPVSRLLGPYFGKWRGQLDTTGAGGPWRLDFQDPVGIGEPLNAELFSVQAGTNTVTDFELNAPSSPVNVVITNQAASGTATPKLAIVAEDY